MTSPSDDAHLDEFDRDEWRDVVRLVRPDWSDERFDAEWDRFVEMKRRRRMH